MGKMKQIDIEIKNALGPDWVKHIKLNCPSCGKPITIVGVSSNAYHTELQGLCVNPNCEKYDEAHWRKVKK